MYIVDMHCDSLSEVDGEHGLINEYNFSSEHPQLQFVAEFSPKKDREPAERRRDLIKDLNTYLYECERLGLSKISSGRDIFSAVEDSKRATLLSIEGGGGLFANSKELSTLYGAGLRVLGMAWDTNELATSAWDKDDNGLTEEGVRLIERCSELGIILDVSHLSDKSFYQTLECSSLPLVATHSNFRSVCASPRNLTRDMAEKIAARGGVIGINLYPKFLNDSGEADMNDILRHIDWGLEYLGEDYIGFGFDIDGTSGQYPKGITEQRSIHEQVIELLLSHYSHSTVEKIAGLNIVEFLKSNLF